MEIIECIHKEKITPSHGWEVAVCSECRQEVRYPVDKLQEKPTVYKLGRIGDRLVLPDPRYRLNLSPQDQEDLAAAHKAAPERQQSSSTTKVSKGAQVTQGVPPRPKKRHQLTQYYEDNKEAMLRDYHSLKLREFYAKWSISTAYWTRLKERWGVKGKRVIPLTPVPPTKGDGLPSLPPFQNNWAAEVQLRWLDIYEKLLSPKGGDV